MPRNRKSIGVHLDAHGIIEKKLAKANIQRTRKGRKVLTKGEWVAGKIKAETIKNIVDMP